MYAKQVLAIFHKLYSLLALKGNVLCASYICLLHRKKEAVVEIITLILDGVSVDVGAVAVQLLAMHTIIFTYVLGKIFLWLANLSTDGWHSAGRIA